MEGWMVSLFASLLANYWKHSLSFPCPDTCECEGIVSYRPSPPYHTDVLVTMVSGNLNIYCEGATCTSFYLLDCVYAKNNANLSFYFISDSHASLLVHMHDVAITYNIIKR